MPGALQTDKKTLESILEIKHFFKKFESLNLFNDNQQNKNPIYVHR